MKIFKQSLLQTVAVDATKLCLANCVGCDFLGCMISQTSEANTVSSTQISNTEIHTVVTTYLYHKENGSHTLKHVTVLWIIVIKAFTEHVKIVGYPHMKNTINIFRFINIL
jgi:hypothetical protein